MFEIRVICDPADSERITTTLNDLFDTGPVRRYPSRGTEKDRLYVTADHRPHSDSWPTAQEAYATAPSIISEIGRTAQAATDKPFGQDIGREFWLRKAAVLDRIALGHDGDTNDAADLATRAARHVMEADGVTPDRLNGDPRQYVRQQYAQWAKTKNQ
ncbi:hypothetical protein ACWDZ4_02440 [Streptomyces sp. NPDC003016]